MRLLGLPAVADRRTLLVTNTSDTQALVSAQVVTDDGAFIPSGADEISVVVQDEGSGFDPKAGRAGFGLRNVLERVEALGGRVVIESVAEQGTTITMSVPKQAGAVS